MRIFGRQWGRGSSDVRQQPPPTPVGSGWYVFEHLAGLALKDPTVIERMTHDQRLVHSVNLVRQEVASGGLQGYFDWTKGSSAPSALAGFELIAPPLGGVLKAALDLQEQQDEPDFESLDSQFFHAEGELDVDSLVDAYIAAHSEGFFK